VFVVATPCPLILAAPIALLGGVSRAARRGVVVKGAGTIERLGRSRAVLFDKTGTLTLGHPVLDRLVATDGGDADDALRLAASADGASMHPFAKAVVAAAELRGIVPPPPDEVRETFGQGVEARVEGHAVLVGGRAWLTTHDVAVPVDGRGNLLVAIDGKLAARGRVADRIRADAQALVPALRQVGIRHVALVTGDARDAAEEVGEALGFDRVYCEQTPAEKLEVVKAVRALPGCCPVIMVGDGINDAPALALADVGIALGSAGSTVSSETADAVLLVDEIGRVTEAIAIGRRALMIARQSVLAGIGASLVAMGFAAAGMLAPVEGALLQEVIDVSVILNALRALRG
jgi:P-type E1-E2 ATPase